MVIRMLPQLIHRLGATMVASALSKEQLCLSFASISQLYPSVQSAPSTSPSGPLLLSEPEAAALAVRARRLAPMCSSMEIGMIACATTTLQWRRADLMESLIQGLYSRTDHTTCRMGKPVPRLLDVVRVVTAAIAADMYFSTTLRAVLEKSSAPIVSAKDDTRLMAAFLSAAYAYFGGRGPSWTSLCVSWKQQAATIPLMTTALESFNQRVADGAMTALLARRQDLRQRLQQEDCYIGAEGAAAARQLVAMFSPASATASETVETLQLYLHHHLQDSVGLKQLEEAALRLLQDADALDAEARRSLESVAYANPQRLHRLFHHLCDGSTSSSNLQRTNPASAVYRTVLEGKRTSEAELYQITACMDTATADEVVQTVYVLFRESKAVPDHAIRQLQATYGQLSLGGLAALLRAARSDVNGHTLPIAEAALRRVNESKLCSAPVDALRDFIGALALPRNRYVHETDLQLQVESDVRDAVLTHVIAMSHYLSLHDLLTISVAAAPIDVRKELTQFTCDAAAQSPQFTHEELVLSASLMTCQDAVHEPLVDRITPHYRTLVEECMDRSGQVTLLHLMEMAAAHAALGAPAWETLGHTVMHRVEQNLASCEAEWLVTAGMLATSMQRLGLETATQQALKLQASNLSPETFMLAAQWMGRCKRPDAVLVAALLERAASLITSPIDSSQIGGRLGECVGTLIAAHCATTTADVDAPPPGIPAAVLEYATEYLPDCNSKLFVSLAQHVYKGGLPSSYTNALLECLPRQLNAMSPEQIAEAVWGFGQLPDAGQRLTHQLVTERVSDYVVDNVDLFWSGPSIARLLHGFARLHCTKRSLYSVFAQRLECRAVRATLTREAISLALSAFGTVKYLDSKLLSRLTMSFTRHAPGLSAPDIVMSLQAHSRLMLLNDKFYHALGDQIAQRHDEFPFKAKCELLHAYGAVEQENDVVAQALVADIAKEVDMFSSVDAAVDVLASLWLMGYNVQVDESARLLADYVVNNASQLTCGGLMKTCSLLSGAEWRYVPLLLAVGDQVVRLRNAEQLQPETGRAALDVLGKFMLHHPTARQEVAQIARTVSKETVQLSQEEADELTLLLAR